MSSPCGVTPILYARTRSTRDKVNPDILWLRDESLEDKANWPSLDMLAAETVEDLQAALEQFSEIAENVA